MGFFTDGNPHWPARIPQHPRYPPQGPVVGVGTWNLSNKKSSVRWDWKWTRWSQKSLLVRQPLGVSDQFWFTLLCALLKSINEFFHGLLFLLHFLGGTISLLLLLQFVVSCSHTTNNECQIELRYQIITDEWVSVQGHNR